MSIPSRSISTDYGSNRSTVSFPSVKRRLWSGRYAGCGSIPEVRLSGKRPFILDFNQHRAAMVFLDHRLG